MMRRTLAAMSLLLVAWVATSPAVAASSRWQVKPGDGSRVEFVSKAPLESFTGRTRQVSGECTFDSDHLAGDVALSVTVDMASFDTGLSKRNQHMRENHLQTDRFPQAFLRGGTIKAAAASALAVGGSVGVEFSGELDLHGVRRPVVVHLELSRSTADVLSVKAEFPVRLSDYDIERPRMLVMKLADEQQVRVDLTLERIP